MYIKFYVYLYKVVLHITKTMTFYRFKMFPMQKVIL